MALAERFAHCVKKLTADFRPASLPGASRKKMTKKEKEGIAIAICTKTILWPQGRTLKHFSMKDGKPNLVTQKRKGGRRRKSGSRQKLYDHQFDA